ncbi:MAG: hypothetical protein SCALA702_03410 [Melioribacteraceae bacterium]|nr:MAG: hypothetical protein SCALA702_03410 [Melioribacteraceae bacterium]
MYKILLLFIAFVISLSAQHKNAVDSTPAEKRINAFEKRVELNDKSVLKNVKFRNVGPTVMSGRVVDVAVNPADPTIFYVAYASGGMWKTTNHGVTFSPVFDNQPVMTLGDIAVDWQNNILYAGTGENNSSRSSYAGNGLYRSLDDGKTWQHLGLAETHRTGDIVINSDNKDVILAGALGSLYSPSPERGVFKSVDGGKTWKKTLYINENTGVIELQQHPIDPNILYAATWHRERRAWNFVESGEGSGIYKSTDMGDTWSLLTTENSGFPTGEGVGRIGLSIFKNNPDVLYAVLDNQYHRPEEKKEKAVVTKEALKNISETEFLNLKDEDLQKFLSSNGFPGKYNAEEVKKLVKSDKIKPQALLDYLGDANDNLFNTPVIGAEVYKSTDAGKTWQKTHEDYLDAVYYSYGYYFGEIRVAPSDENILFVGGVPLIKSTDGGKTFFSANGDNVHADHQALWVNPTNPNHVLDGNDGGLNLSYDGGENWLKLNNPAVGQFYTVQVDMAEPYNVYGGLQDNGVWVGPSTYQKSDYWHQSGRYPYEELSGGDGMQIQIDTRSNDIIYTGYQFGYYYRITRSTNDYKFIRPVHELGEFPYRFNWQTPLHLSKHNMDILYLGSNKLHRSMKNGENWEVISGDLTKGGKKGDVPYGTLTSIDESPLKFGLIYTGSDDGLIHVTRDGGVTWKEISKTLPQDYWVSRVEASSFAQGRVYVSLNGYRWDNFESLVYVSEDFGETWTKIGENIPAEPVNVIKEDPTNENVLYVGTDHALYVSLDRGKTFVGMNSGMPYAPVHDLVIHPRDNDLVVGTHGRSIYVADVEFLQMLTPEIMAEEFKLLNSPSKRYSSGWGNKDWLWNEPEDPKVTFPYWSKDGGELKIEIKTENDLIVYQENVKTDKGLNYYEYHLVIDEDKLEDYKSELNSDVKPEKKDSGKFYLEPGKYFVNFTLGEKEITTELEIKGK